MVTFGDCFSTVVGMTDAGKFVDVENDVCRLMKACDLSFRFSLTDGMMF